MMVYEKPSLKFYALRSNTNVAGNCWSQDANGSVDYWVFYPFTQDDKSVWVKFEVNDNCNSSDFTPLEYHGIGPDDIVEGTTVYDLLMSYQKDKQLKLSAGDSNIIDEFS